MGWGFLMTKESRKGDTVSNYKVSWLGLEWGDSLELFTLEDCTCLDIALKSEIHKFLYGIGILVYWNRKENSVWCWNGHDGHLPAQWTISAFNHKFIHELNVRTNSSISMFQIILKDTFLVEDRLPDSARWKSKKQIMKTSSLNLRKSNRHTVFHNGGRQGDPKPGRKRERVWYAFIQQIIVSTY